MAGGALIDTVESLRRHLQAAIELEHATIPLYLTALYSIEEGSNTEATAVIRSVVMEEMLHMSLAANLLNAVHGTPQFNHDRFVPTYPGFLPFSDRSLELRLLKLSPESVRIFLAVERPAKPNAPPEPDHFHTIGQFYQAIADGLRHLCRIACDEREVFSGDPALQVGPAQYYGGGGGLFGIYGLDDALRALSVIVDEGEGLAGEIADGDHLYFDQKDEPAHFFRFNQLRCGRYYRSTDTPRSGPTGRPLEVEWQRVHDMAPDPSMAKLPPGSALWRKSLAFNSRYSRLLDDLHEAFNGRPDHFAAAIAGMYELKYAAQALMRMRLPGSRQTAGPSFEYVPPRDRC
jgi:hypothetical protein